MQNEFVNHARNIWDRAVTLLPRVDVFWYKYTYMEELVGAIEQARQLFERWMKWLPDDNAWSAYIRFELRQGDLGRARGCYNRYVAALPTTRAYLRFARWEEKVGQRGNAREVYERALVELHISERSEKLLINFARFEERCKEIERARVIFKYALEQAKTEGANDEKVRELNGEYIAFEKRHGSRQGIEDAILSKRRAQYEDRLKEDRFNYDVWFDLARLEEEEGDLERARDVYERAISNVPPAAEKRYWRRYIYLWISYALFEELQAKDMSRARDVYQACLALIPHKKFTFAKIWLLAANLEVRAKDLTAARLLLGRAIGICAKRRIFQGYIDLELQMGEIDRCRSIYTKFLEFAPHDVSVWTAFAKLEVQVGEIERARALFELAVSQSTLDMPEALWKAYIDFEVAEMNAERARGLYERLLVKTSHVKVWISYAQFEAAQEEQNQRSEDDADVDEGATEHRARRVFERGYAALKEAGLKEERLLLLEAWKAVETGLPGGKRTIPSIHILAFVTCCSRLHSGGIASKVEAMMPRKLKMRRRVAQDEGGGSNAVVEEEDEEWEDYYDYIFPDDEKPVRGLKLLENAAKWKLAMAAQQQQSQSQQQSIGDEGNGEEVSTLLGKRNAVDMNEVDIDEDLDE